MKQIEKDRIVRNLTYRIMKLNAKIQELQVWKSDLEFCLRLALKERDKKGE